MRLCDAHVYSCMHQHHHQCSLCKSECSRMSSPCPFFRLSCSLPTIEKKRSTPAERDAGRPRYCYWRTTVAQPIGDPLDGASPPQTPSCGKTAATHKASRPRLLQSRELWYACRPALPDPLPRFLSSSISPARPNPSRVHRQSEPP